SASPRGQVQLALHAAVLLPGRRRRGECTAAVAPSRRAAVPCRRDGLARRLIAACTRLRQGEIARTRDRVTSAGGCTLTDWSPGKGARPHMVYESEKGGNHTRSLRMGGERMTRGEALLVGASLAVAGGLVSFGLATEKKAPHSVQSPLRLATPVGLS